MEMLVQQICLNHCSRSLFVVSYSKFRNHEVTLLTEMEIHVLNNPMQMGQAAAVQSALLIRRALAEKEEANIILATGASQLRMLEQLVLAPDIDWGRVRMFHLDEYLGLSEDHPASFVRYLKERFVYLVPPLKATHFIQPYKRDPNQVCQELGRLIEQHPIDVAMIGIGENGHLAFNDPPADFQTTKPYLMVNLDQDCRLQQMKEGWFPNLESVPRQAISMSIRQIMKSRHLVVSVPDERKAEAVKNALAGEVRPECPASILREHPSCSLFLDRHAAILL
jgi:glucosamine-6-phosphate deaminase